MDSASVHRFSCVRVRFLIAYVQACCIVTWWGGVFWDDLWDAYTV